MYFEDDQIPAQDGVSYVVYDGDCPFCSAYVKLVRLREVLGKVTLVNARDGGALVDYLAGRHVVLDQEMALVTRGQVYSGPDCINQLALMSTPSSAFNRLNAVLFSSPRVARIAYPILRSGRNATLWLLGRGRLKRLPAG